MDGNITTILSLLILAYIERRGWVGRLTVFGNALIIYVSIFPLMSIMPDYLQAWTYGGIIAGIICVLSYLNKGIKVEGITKLLYLPYSSKTVLGVYIASLLGIINLSLAFVIVIWTIAVIKLDHKI